MFATAQRGAARRYVWGRGRGRRVAATFSPPPPTPPRARQQSGLSGNGAALRHYEATGRKYPLVVKLGTITPHGADVYSYAPDEDDMVTDPKLAEHLAHWGAVQRAGLNHSRRPPPQMEKTEKNMTELQIDANLAAEYDKITEAGKTLRPLSGPG